MDRFELPADITSLSNEDLESLLVDAVAAFDAGTNADSVTAEDLETLKQMAGDIKVIRAEKTARSDAAEQAAADIAALAAEVHGETAAAEGGEGDEPAEGDDGQEPVEGDEDPEAPLEGENAAEAAVEAEPEPELVTASGSKRPLDLASIRARQKPQKAPAVAKAAEKVRILASADVPGMSIGQDMDIDALVTGVTARANGLKSANRAAQAMVASYTIPFPEHLQVTDPSSAGEGMRATMAAADQSRLPGGDLIASGGWCAPSETIYDIADVACPDALWSAPEIQMKRGGLRFYQTPSLDVSNLTWIHTEANDIANAEKPCFKIPCPDPIEVRCEAIGVCLESGILTERHFPELVAWYVRNSMVAHEIRVSQAMFLGAVAASTHIVMEETMGAFAAVFGAVALQAADLTEKHSLCEGTGIEVTFPFWAKNAFLTDIARQNGKQFDEIDEAIIARAFASLGISMQWARGLPPTVPTDIGGATPAAAWPDSVPFLIHPTGAFQVGRGAEVNLGAVYDSAKFKTNDYTALFTEECVALVPRGPESRFVEVPICPDGTTGALATGVDCPIDANSVVS